MQKSRLIEVLQTFSKKELRELKKWLASPMHNQRQDVIDLYDYLLKEDHLRKEAALEKEKVYSLVYPNETYDDAKMRQVIHFMFKAVEAYLAFATLTSEDIKVKLALLNTYRQRKLAKNFSKTQKEIENYFQNAIHIDEDNFYNQYLFQKEIYEFNSLIKRTQELNLQEVTDTFDTAFIAEKLKQACLILAHQNVYKIEYGTGLLDNLVKYIESETIFDIPRINIYYFLYKITEDKNNTEDFFKLKKIIKENESISKTEILSIYLGAINFCINLANSGNPEFIREAFELYKNGIERKVFIENGILSRWTFKNVISAALRLKEYAWTESFIENNGQHLEEKYRESFIHFNLAKLYYQKGDYKKTLAMFHKYEFDDILVNLDAKTMLLKIYYELEELKAMEALLESMRAYLHRKKELGNRINGYKNIVRYTKKLIKVNPYNKDHVAKLRQEIEAATPLTEKEWLLKQLDAL